MANHRNREQVRMSQIPLGASIAPTGNLFRRRGHRGTLCSAPLAVNI